MTTFDSVQFGFRLWCVNEKKKEKKNEESRFRWDTVFAYLVLSSILSCALTFLALTVERRGSEFDRTRRGRNETRRRETKIERAPVRAYEPCAKENECVREMRVGERKWKKGCRRKRGRKMKRECLLFCAKCHFSSRVGGCSFLFFFFFFSADLEQSVEQSVLRVCFYEFNARQLPRLLRNDDVSTRWQTRFAGLFFMS